VQNNALGWVNILFSDSYRKKGKNNEGKVETCTEKMKEKLAYLELRKQEFTQQELSNQKSSISL
jgi:hypothetical protein